MPASSPLSRLGDLVVDQDLEFQKRSWRVQRLGQIAICLLVLAALLGVFGRGWLARREVESSGLHVTHSRFLRMQAPDEIVVRLDPLALPRSPDLAHESQVELWMDHSLTEFLEFTKITPEPTAQAARDGRTLFRFTLEGAQPATLRFRSSPRGWGWRVGRLGLTDAGEVELWQFVYP